MAEVKLRALVLREVDFGDWDRYLTVLAEDGRKVEILCKNARRGKKTNPAARQLCFSEFILAERGEKYALREADRRGAEIILCEGVEPVGVGLAVMNRLLRAAAFRVVE